MTETDTKEPRGVIAIMVSPDGDVIATVADFARDVYGGFKMWVAQRYRVRRRILWETVKAYASPRLTDGLTDYLVEQIGNELVGARRDKGKHKLVLRSIGWPDDVREEIER